MSHQPRVSIVVLIVLTAVGSLSTVPVTGQSALAAASANEAAYAAPRTPDGQPDLQGFWNNQTYTPLERPDDVTKEFYTLEEAAALEQVRAQREGEQTTPGTTADVHYDNSQFGLDRSQTGFARNLRTSLIVDPPNGKLPPVNAEGQRRMAERAAAREAMGGKLDRAENNDLDDRCLMRNAGPPTLNANYNSNQHIVQGPRSVMILVEESHDARIISLDGREPPPDAVRQWRGFSRGRWEGDTLVVETTNFNGKNPFRGRSSEHMRVTERFTRVADDRILYRFTVEDTATWDQPWTGEMPMWKSIGPLFEHACHEGNYGLYNTLAGARLEEQRAAEEAARQEQRR
jgi:hypothetical protein